MPELYRLAAEKRGVFVNSALTEPFGLTLIEAASCGLPIVAPNDGGPLDIVKNCRCGELVDTTDTLAMARVIKKILSDEEKWNAFSKSGILNVRKLYTWESHAVEMARNLKPLVEDQGTSKMKVAVPSDAIGRRLAKLNYFIITDIDNTLIGEENDQLDALLNEIKTHRNVLGFGVATGRSIDSCRAFLGKNGVHPPDIIVASVGAEIYYGKNRHYGKGWETHISAKWDREKIVELLKDLRFLSYQKPENQRRFKISYDMEPAKDRLAMIHDRPLRSKCRYTLIYSHGKHVDILPFRASKGKAIRYISYKWEIPLKNFLVCGDSGNDEEMLRGEPLGVVVGNYSPELENLKGQRNIYFAAKKCAGGILEAIRRFNFIEKATQAVDSR